MPGEGGAMFQIAIQDPTTQTGSVAVSWCAGRDLLERLSARGVKNPYVLVITAPAGSSYNQSRERRKVCLLKEGMTYVEFAGDGPCRVHAMIVWGGETELRQLVFQRSDNSWSTDWLTNDGTRFLDQLHAQNNVAPWRNPSWGLTLLPREHWTDDDHEQGWRAATADLEVEVPAGCFAKPPPAWEAPWVNHWFRDPPQDECAYRKRRLWAYSLQPPFMVAVWLIRLLMTTVAQLALFKQVSWAPVRHLLTSSIDEVYENFTRGNYLWPKSWGKHPMGFFARCVLPLFSPLGLMVIGLITYPFSDGVMDFTWQFASTLCSSVLSVIACAALIKGWIFVSDMLVDRFNTKRATQAQQYEYLQPETVEFLACDAMPQARSYRTLPRERRTVRLLYEAVKGSVCRPFAR